jgi:Kef-type K+ transport system membrane component KefB
MGSISRRQLRRLSAAALVATVAVILLTTLTPIGAGDSRETGGCALGLPCAVGHFVLFGALGVAIAGRYAVSAAAARSPRRALAMALLAVWLFAAADELAQTWWVEGRDGEFVDWAADMAGAIVGLALAGPVLRVLVRS